MRRAAILALTPAQVRPSMRPSEQVHVPTPCRKAPHRTPGRRDRRVAIYGYVSFLRVGV